METRTDTEDLCHVCLSVDVGAVRSGTRDGAVKGEVGSEMEQPGSCGGALGTEATLLHGSW